jgi:hypothetical protein
MYGEIKIPLNTFFTFVLYVDGWSNLLPNLITSEQNPEEPIKIRLVGEESNSDRCGKEEISYLYDPESTDIFVSKSIRILSLNPLTPEVNPSAQRCLMRFFTGIFLLEP